VSLALETSELVLTALFYVSKFISSVNLTQPGYGENSTDCEETVCWDIIDVRQGGGEIRECVAQVDERWKRRRKRYIFIYLLCRFIVLKG
jgi:hypothetical protein